MSQSSCLSKLFLIGLLSFALGLYLEANILWPVEQIKNSIHAVQGYAATYDRYGRLASFPGKIEVTCPVQSERTVVLLLVGQSNAANYANYKSKTAFGNRVVNYFDGRCFIASSPLLGAMELRGEGWTPLADMLVGNGRFEQVVLIPMAIGATPLERWTKGGDLNQMLLDSVKEIAKQYRITHVLWHQGESDALQKTKASSYQSMFHELVDSLRYAGIVAPVYVSVATHCGTVETNDVALAQASLPELNRRIYSGPSTDDSILDSDRYDGCHFRMSGVMKFAAAWFEVLRLSEAKNDATAQ